jgi:hypothetical protein
MFDVLNKVLELQEYETFPPDVQQELTDNTWSLQIESDWRVQQSHLQFSIYMKQKINEWTIKIEYEDNIFNLSFKSYK